MEEREKGLLCTHTAPNILRIILKYIILGSTHKLGILKCFYMFKNWAKYTKVSKEVVCQLETMYTDVTWLSFID